MTSLSEAGALIRNVEISKGKYLSVSGISLDGVVLLLDRFPEFKELITPKRGAEEKPTEFSLETLIKMGPRIIGAVIAAGTNEPGSEKAENAAKALPVGVQTRLVREIMDATFPGGLGPFVEDLRLMGLLGPASTEEEQPASPSSKSSPKGASGDTGKGQDTKSSSPPKSSGDGDTTKS